VRWLVDVEKDLWEIKVQRWRQMALINEEWASVDKGTKALSGPLSQGLRE
jgi:hypothetical protein